MAGAVRLLPGKSLHLRHRRGQVADHSRALPLIEGDGGPDHQTFLAPDPSLFRSVYAAPHRLGDEGTRSFAARPRRPPSRLRGRGPSVHVGQSLSRARPSPLAVRARSDQGHLRRQAAHGWRVVHADRDARLVARDLPPQSRQLAPHLLARLSARPSAGVGAAIPNDQAWTGPTRSRTLRAGLVPRGEWALALPQMVEQI